MELEEFIRSSILQIMRDITAAQDEWKRPTAGEGTISPVWGGPEDLPNRLQEVKFDVAVTAAAKNETSGGGGIKVVALDLSGKLGRSTESSTISRIAFTIPILPPTVAIRKLEEAPSQ